MKNQLHIILLGLVCLFSFQLFAQDFEWVSTGGDYGLDASTSIAVDPSGNVYAVGRFSGTVDFNEGGEPHVHTALGYADAFILKKDISGELLWVKILKATSAMSASEIKLDGSGDILIAGDFNDSVDFDPGVGEEFRAASGGADGFVLKLNEEGNFQWVKTYGTGGNVKVWAMILDKDDNIISTGNFSDTPDFDPGPAEVLRTALGFMEIFVQKLDPEGNLLWVNHYISTEDNADFATDVNCTVEGDILITGVFYGGVDFDLSDDEFYATAMPTGASFVLKLSAPGELIWVKHVTGEMSQTIIRSVTVSPTGDIYTLGRFSGIIDLDPGDGEVEVGSNGESDVFIQKFDAEGDLQWVKSIGTPFSEYTAAITYNENGYVLFYIDFPATIDMDPSEEEFNLTSEGGYDIGLGILDEEGAFVSAISIGGDWADYAYTMTTDNAHNIYLGGSFSSTVNFDPSGSEIRTSNGEEDFFVLKLSETLSLKEEIEPNRGVVYPNPTNDFVHIQSNPGSQIELIDFSGRVCQTMVSNKNIESINVSKYKPGVYFIRILGDGDYTTKKLIIR